MQTIENTREKDVTMVAPDDAEVEADDADDEFASETPPVFLVITSYLSSAYLTAGIAQTCACILD